ncbi:ParB/RepB/Spo0J family partition protein [Stutzerimonas kunmingensis]|uniref:ParB/RepB/Spo0J family partition protein n=1 Tax=Stutzerimonas kunmingensis TaxID=1211807 RepID=UPI0028B10590|nr:ParB N-terminal domain-containing protein [Stutzerimonas kunmingensis]
MSDSISDLLNAAEDAGIQIKPGDQIQRIHRSLILPDPNQNRDDWDDPATRAHIEGIRKLMTKKLPSGQFFGIRLPLLVGQPNEEGKVPLIDGECRWRASEGVEEELQYLPCLVRAGDPLELRMDHATSNGARKDLTLYQTARAIQRDKEEFGLSNEDIAAIHGLRGAKAVSKHLAVLKLSPEAQKFAKDGSFKDVNLIYELRDLDPSELKKLEKLMAKGDSFQQALKAITNRKKAKEAPNNTSGEPESATGQPSPPSSKGSDSEPSEKITLRGIDLAAAVALADLLGVEDAANLPHPALEAKILASITSLA